MIRSAAKASISRTRSAVGLLLNQLDQRHSLVGHRHLHSGSRSRNPNLLRRSAMAASVTDGRALRYAGGSARGLLHHVLGHVADDIGYWNISAYNRGMMGYRTPNIDRLAEEGAIFTDYYGQQSCTAGRAAFITGQSPMRTGLLKVGLPGAPEGLSGRGPDHRRSAEAARLHDRSIRQESPRRPQRIPADRPRFRRVLRQPLPPQCRG